MTKPVRKGEELDWDVLDKHLKGVLTYLEGIPEISQFAGGNSISDEYLFVLDDP